MLVVDKETFGPEVLEAEGYVLVDFEMAARPVQL